MTSLSIALAEIRFPWVDPVAIELPGPVDVRWYGLMYLVGFGAGYLILRRLARVMRDRRGSPRIHPLLRPGRRHRTSPRGAPRLGRWNVVPRRSSRSRDHARLVRPPASRSAPQPGG